MFDRQLFLNEVIDKLVDQNRRAVSTRGACRYRHTTRLNNDLRCGIGHMITDEEYDYRMEGYRVSGILPYLPEAKRKVWEEELNFLTSVQSAHDNGYTGQELIERFELVAKHFNLVLPAKLERVRDSWNQFQDGDI